MGLDGDDGELLLSGREQLCELARAGGEVEDASTLKALDSCSSQEFGNRIGRVGGSVRIIEGCIGKATDGLVAEATGFTGGHGSMVQLWRGSVDGTARHGVDGGSNHGRWPAAHQSSATRPALRRALLRDCAVSRVRRAEERRCDGGKRRRNRSVG
jgi:hypothetical protein